ncbi:alcohol dehydrogenase catalytic domain-containing protein [Eubacteriales bacterium OttesenSCG-928-N14]|nr:alcohol dehydrogenase catalytic domain-containing protein [Eubacteriales bacterium OttesenSCG-928-N14]
MKAAMYYGPKDVRIEDIPMPEPGPGEILMKIKAATTCGTDVKTYMRGYAKDTGEPRIFGHEAAGIVEAVGEGVTKFKVGDRIVPHNTYPCGHCYWCKRSQPSMCENFAGRGGTFCGYTVLPKRLIELNTFLIPDNIDFASAAMVEPLSCAVYGVDEANIQLNDIVVINGAGPLGLYMVKIASMRGGRVICCDLSEDRLKVAKKLGAWQTVHVTEGMDQVQAVRDLTPNNRGADVVIEAVGLPEVWEMALGMVRKGGLVEWFGGCKAGAKVTVDTTLMHYGQLTLKGIFHTTPLHVEMAFNMIANGDIKGEDFIGKEYPLEECIEAIESHARKEAIKNVIVFD